MRLFFFTTFCIFYASATAASNVDAPSDASLIRAVTSKNVTELKTLASTPGANVNAVEEYGRTLLHLAIERDFTEGVRILIEAGANATIVTDHRAGFRAGENALHYASAGGNSEIVDLLLENGAELSVKNGHGMSALHIASGLGRIEVVKKLLGDKRLVAVDDPTDNQYGSTPMHLAATSLNNGLEVLKVLLSFGRPTDVNVRNKKLSSVLHAAAAAGNVSIVSYILDNGGDASALDENKETPLMLARSRSAGDKELANKMEELEKLLGNPKKEL